MKTLILYATKYGCTQKCAELLAKKLNGKITLHNISTASVPPLDGFDSIVLGTSIKMNTIDSKMRAYCKNNETQLSNHSVSLFICATNEDALQSLKANFSPILFETIKHIQFVGGEMSTDKAKGFDKVIYKIVGSSMKKSGKTPPCISEENIQSFADKLNEQSQK